MPARRGGLGLFPFYFHRISIPNKWEVHIVLRIPTLYLVQIILLRTTFVLILDTSYLLLKNLLPIPNLLPRNNYFFISCSDGKFRCFGKKI
jgi:hypothetical protein